MGEFYILAHATKGASNAPPAATPTEIPEPTEKPTATPKPTKEPTKAPMVTGNTSSFDTSVNSLEGLAKKAKQGYHSFREYPTPILSVSSAAAQKKMASHSAKKQTVLVKDIQGKNPVAVGVFFLGGVLFLACGILIFMQKRRSMN